MTPGTSYSPPPAFGRFRLQHQIGAGVLGPVFRTVDEQDQQLVAVKAFTLDITPERAAELSNRLQRLVDIDLRHPHIALPIATGVEASVAYLAQQYVEGESLDAAIRQYGPAPAADVMRMIGHAAEALELAARVGVFHGSLHPRDIMVTPVETRVTGLGVPMALEGIGQHGPIRRPYAAPEREAGLEWGAAADVFSLAVIAYEVLTGRRALPGTEQPFPGLADIQVHDVAALRELFETAIDPEPERRPANVRDFASAMALTLVDGGVVRAPGDRAGGSRRKIKPRPPKLPGLDPPYQAEASAAVLPAVELTSEPSPVVDVPMPVAPVEDRRELRYDWDAEEVEPGHPVDGAEPVDVAHGAPEPAVPTGVEPSERYELRMRPTPRLDPVVPIISTRHDVPPRAEWDEADTDGPQSLFAAEPAEPPPPPPRSVMPESAVDDARDPEVLGLDLPVPRAIDPTRSGENFARPPRRYEPDQELQPDRSYAPIAIAAAAGLLLGLLGGYEMGARWGAQRSPTSAAVTPTQSVPAGEPARRPTATGAAPVAAPVPAAAPASAVPQAPTPRPTVVAQRATPAAVKPAGATKPPAAAGTPTAASAPARRAAVAPVTRAPVAARKPAATKPVATSAVSFDSRPPGARVLLDGKDVGITPFALKGVAAGRHSVELRLAGFGPWTTSITVVAGKPRRVSASLERNNSR